MTASIRTNSAILMVHMLISDHPNRNLDEGFNHQAWKLLQESILTELGSLACITNLRENNVVSEIAILGDVLEMEGEDS